MCVRLANVFLIGEELVRRSLDDLFRDNVSATRRFPSAENADTGGIYSAVLCGFASLRPLR